MPEIKNSCYRPPKLINNGHMLTIYPFFFRKVNHPAQYRERIQTRDNDFLDIVWNQVNSDKLVIISHGLEGCTETPYMKGMSREYNQSGFDSLTWNMRSCSGEINIASGFYTALSINDLDDVIKHALKLKSYKEIHLVGFSLGASLTANYLALSEKYPSEVTSAIIYSCPLDLKATSVELSKPAKRFYLETFMVTMRKKIVEKSKRDQISTRGIWGIKSFEEFDNRFTAPLHGFKNALDYYNQGSCINHLDKIKAPLLIVNAQDDPFLTKECFPTERINKISNIYLEAPKSGGHVGFVSFNKENTYWSEKRAVRFSLETSGQKALIS